MSSELVTQPQVDPAFLLELGALIVDTLGLDVVAADIDPDAPLYGDGLGLDSIDILEIALVVSKQYGVQLRADDADNQRVFSSLRQLAVRVKMPNKA
ncbi:acyl carrier protein [mine drainage metagenome]|jgi:acyl carrier protein|uniref:Acyl carrier protein n=1 Tax=mine drainage metagenome TaxID=410659 RepID=A0A1J5RCX7_9ZZZZ